MLQRVAKAFAEKVEKGEFFLQVSAGQVTKCIFLFQVGERFSQFDFSIDCYFKSVGVDSVFAVVDFCVVVVEWSFRVDDSHFFVNVAVENVFSVEARSHAVRTFWQATFITTKTAVKYLPAARVTKNQILKRNGFSGASNHRVGVNAVIIARRAAVVGFANLELRDFRCDCHFGLLLFGVIFDFKTAILPA